LSVPLGTPKATSSSEKSEPVCRTTRGHILRNFNYNFTLSKYTWW